MRCGAGRSVPVSGRPDAVLRRRVLRSGIGAARHCWRSRQISVRDVSVHGRRDRRTRAGSLLDRRSPVRTTSVHDSARPQLAIAAVSARFWGRIHNVNERATMRFTFRTLLNPSTARIFGSRRRCFVETFDSHARRYRQPNECRFDQIIGASPALESVLEQVERVAPTQATVLIHGETGTGKELVARAVHALSPRCGRAFVKVNCAAIPLDLLESELFGHEKGAFTGAIAQKIGRFEVADRGTLFLDEVGDIPLALQPKLLRVLQEQEFERLGSTQTHRVDVRLIAATNRNLDDMVQRSEYRIDLYYRFNVFPILLPPLRERREDIPALVKHYIERFSTRVGKRIQHVPPETLAAFMTYDWPGNIRELQNAIERAVIMSDDGVLPNPLPPGARAVVTVPATTLYEADWTLILNTLESVRWVVAGPKGAARKLGLNRNTLISKMRRLGISRPQPDEPRTLTLNDAAEGRGAAVLGFDSSHAGPS